MRILTFLLVVGLFQLSPALAGGEAVLFFGSKELDDGDWDPVADQSALGVDLIWGGESWPLLLEAGWRRSDDDDRQLGLEFEGETTEIALGLRRIVGRRSASRFASRRLRTHIGAGLALVQAEITKSGFGETESADDDAVGYWLGAGLGWRIGPRFTLGVDGRFTTADVEPAGIEGEGGGLQLGLSLGYRFSGR